MFRMRRPSCAGYGAASIPVSASRSNATSVAAVVTGSKRGESIANRYHWYSRPSRCYNRACKARAYTRPHLT